jgi:hypothetical protein
MRLFILAALLATLHAQSVTAVDPATAKAGDTVSATGAGIDNGNVDSLYLTDGTNDVKCDVVQQTATAIKFKVPGTIKPGRWAVMVHTTKGQFIEEPVKLTVQ